MKKYKNVKAVKAHHCSSYIYDFRNMCFYCMGVKLPFRKPKCKGIMCKCTEYKYKRGKLV